MNIVGSAGDDGFEEDVPSTRTPMLGGGPGGAASSSTSAANRPTSGGSKGSSGMHNHNAPDGPILYNMGDGLTMNNLPVSGNKTL